MSRGFVGPSNIFKFANSSGYNLILSVKSRNYYLSFTCSDQTGSQTFIIQLQVIFHQIHGIFMQLFAAIQILIVIFMLMVL